jgi:hypothetical protein
MSGPPLSTSGDSTHDPSSEERERFRREFEERLSRMFPRRPAVEEPYRVVFDLFPADYFGGGEEEIDLSRTSVGDGNYGGTSEELHIPLTVGAHVGQLDRNRLVVTVIDSDPSHAHEKAAEAVRRLLRNLSIQTKLRFEHKLVGVWVGTSARLLPGEVQSVHQVFYNSAAARQALELASRRAMVIDDRLDRALAFYEHGVQLLQLANETGSDFHDPIPARELAYQAFLTDVILSLWKAQVQILGEGRRRTVIHAKILRLPDSLIQDLARVDTIRNGAGVAHTNPDPLLSEDLRKQMNFCRTTVETLLEAYNDHVTRFGPLPALKSRGVSKK